MTVGGMTQYLTMVQGMPKDVETHLDNRIKSFIWSGKKAAINQELLLLPVEEGGKNLLSIKDRNDAINLKTLQKYLDDGEDRGAWCYLADKSLNKNVASGIVVPENARTSTFIQKWAPLQKKLPKPLKRMYKTAQKFGLRLDALSLSQDLKEIMPIWFHHGATEDLVQHNNSIRGKCLRNAHSIRTV
ncbi:hypothetical protein C8R43DRAFT_882676, partial [Mycena crocata]